MKNTQNDFDDTHALIGDYDYVDYYVSNETSVQSSVLGDKNY